MVLNSTPLRTSRNFNINDIKLSGINVNENVSEFKNINIVKNTSKIKIEDDTKEFDVVYGISDKLIDQSFDSYNFFKKVTVDSLLDKEIIFTFKFDEKNKELVDNIKIDAKENTKSTIVLKYECDGDINYYHNLMLRVNAQKNSHVTVIILNYLNINSNNFVTIQNKVGDDSTLNYYMIDLGGKNTIVNYYSNLTGVNSKNNINTLYVGRENEIFDFNYIVHLSGEKSDVNIDVQGALNESSKKHFKGTIDFKKGCKKACGNENESCMLLSDKARSMSLPMLLCSEEDVEGNHSCSAGKIGDKELFYITSRGFDKKEAMKLLVKAKFNKIIESIKNENIKAEILEKIDEKLD